MEARTCSRTTLDTRPRRFERESSGPAAAPSPRPAPPPGAHEPSSALLPPRQEITRDRDGGIPGLAIRSFTGGARAPAPQVLENALRAMGGVFATTGTSVATLGALLGFVLGARMQPRMRSQIGPGGGFTILPENRPIKAPITLNFTKDFVVQGTTAEPTTLGAQAGQHLALSAAVAILVGVSLCLAGRGLKALAARSQASRIAGEPSAEFSRAGAGAAVCGAIGRPLMLAGMAASALGGSLRSLEMTQEFRGQMSTGGIVDLGGLGTISADASASLDGPVHMKGALGLEGFGDLSTGSSCAVLGAAIAAGLGLVLLSEHLEHRAEAKHLERWRTFPR